MKRGRRQEASPFIALGQEESCRIPYHLLHASVTIVDPCLCNGRVSSGWTTLRSASYSRLVIARYGYEGNFQGYHPVPPMADAIGIRSIIEQ